MTPRVLVTAQLAVIFMVYPHINQNSLYICTAVYLYCFLDLWKIITNIVYMLKLTDIRDHNTYVNILR